MTRQDGTSLIWIDFNPELSFERRFERSTRNDKPLRLALSAAHPVAGLGHFRSKRNSTKYCKVSPSNLVLYRTHWLDSSSLAAKSFTPPQNLPRRIVERDNEQRTMNTWAVCNLTRITILSFSRVPVQGGGRCSCLNTHIDQKSVWYPPPRFVECRLAIWHRRGNGNLHNGSKDCPFIFA